MRAAVSICCSAGLRAIALLFWLDDFSARADRLRATLAQRGALHNTIFFCQLRGFFGANELIELLPSRSALPKVSNRAGRFQLFDHVAYRFVSNEHRLHRIDRNLESRPF